MDFLKPPLSFDTTKPFYGLVLSYLSQVHGFNELASRGIYQDIQRLDPPSVETMLAQIDDVRTREAVSRIATSGKTALLADTALGASHGQRIDIDTDALADHLSRNHRAALPHFHRLATGALLIVAWEVTRGSRHRTPTWEFMRHCRNAAAHDGRFRFRNGEPRHPAAWRGARIISTLEGQLLFYDGAGSGLMGPADVLYLLSDIEADAITSRAGAAAV